MIRIIDNKIAKDDLKTLCQEYFDTMVKFVVDIEMERVALGGELHSDAESMLLQEGSKQSDLWGGNLYPWNEPHNRIECTSFINIRPMDENMSMEITNKERRQSVKDIIEKLVLSPDEDMES